MKFYKVARRFGSKLNNKVVAGAAIASTTALTAVPAFAAPTIDDIWTACDLSGVSGKVIPIAVLVVGITLIGTALVLSMKAAKKARGSL